MTTASNLRVLRTIPLLIAFCFVSFPAQAEYGGGTGEANDPYQIATAEDLLLLGESPGDYDEHFILTGDIDPDPNLQGRQVFSQAAIQVFSGGFDGNNHTISHLTIRGKNHFLGMFGQLGSGATISNLALEAADINGTGGYVGSLEGNHIVDHWRAVGHDLQN
ncbi:MAG: hypothetical protein ACYTE3_06110 [Planctomycetota bacterium]|jgi:hypothetical protein